MIKILRLIILLIIVFVIYVSYVTIPKINKIIACYDLSVQNFDEIEVQSRVQGWSDAKRCEIRFNQLNDTKSCLTNVIESYNLPFDLNIISTQILTYIRPGISNISKLITDHDENCQNYPKTQFDPLKYRN
jgi:hypothetical protein